MLGWARMCGARVQATGPKGLIRDGAFTKKAGTGIALSRAAYVSEVG